MYGIEDLHLLAQGRQNVSKVNLSEFYWPYFFSSHLDLGPMVPVRDLVKC